MTNDRTQVPGQLTIFDLIEVLDIPFDDDIQMEDIAHVEHDADDERIPDRWEKHIIWRAGERR